MRSLQNQADFSRQNRGGAMKFKTVLLFFGVACVLTVINLASRRLAVKSPDIHLIDKQEIDELRLKIQVLEDTVRRCIKTANDQERKLLILDEHRKRNVGLDPGFDRTPAWR
jgi:hypothetical protein